jgi:hypothetical protein
MFDPLPANSSFEGTLVARQHRAILSPATSSVTSAIGPHMALFGLGPHGRQRTIIDLMRT